MFYSISHNSIASISAGYKINDFSGSSSYKVVGQQIIKKTRERAPITKTYVRSGETTSVGVQADLGVFDSGSYSNVLPDTHIAPCVMGNCTDESPKTYTLNKSKVKKKIAAFFTLNASKNFCAFYSISFPFNLSDKLAYQLFNTWLTRCRTLQGLHSYLWISERQANGTIHFHLITNVFMKIKEVNGYMRASLITQLNKGNLTTPLATLEAYNGCDVDNLYKSKRADQKKKTLDNAESRRKLQRYLTKYVSKNDIAFYRLPWHCSRDVSALFTSEMFNEDEYNKLTLMVREQPHMFTIIEKESIIIYIPLFNVNMTGYTRLESLNNQVHKKFFEDSCQNVS